MTRFSTFGLFDTIDSFVFIELIETPDSLIDTDFIHAFDSIMLNGLIILIVSIAFNGLINLRGKRQPKWARCGHANQVWQRDTVRVLPNPQ